VFEVKEVKKTSPYMYVIKDKNDETIKKNNKKCVAFNATRV
jgi:hypothetical protein